MPTITADLNKDEYWKWQQVKVEMKANTNEECLLRLIDSYNEKKVK